MRRRSPTLRPLISAPTRRRRPVPEDTAAIRPALRRRPRSASESRPVIGNPLARRLLLRLTGPRGGPLARLGGLLAWLGPWMSLVLALPAVLPAGAQQLQPIPPL